MYVYTVLTFTKQCTSLNTNQYLIVQLVKQQHLESVACSHSYTKVRVIQAASPSGTTMFCGVLRPATAMSIVNGETVQVKR